MNGNPPNLTQPSNRQPILGTPHHQRSLAHRLVTHQHYLSQPKTKSTLYDQPIGTTQNTAVPWFLCNKNFWCGPNHWSASWFHRFDCGLVLSRSTAVESKIHLRFMLWIWERTWSPFVAAVSRSASCDWNRWTTGSNASNQLEMYMSFFASNKTTTNITVTLTRLPRCMRVLIIDVYKLPVIKAKLGWAERCAQPWFMKKWLKHVLGACGTHFYCKSLGPWLWFVLRDVLFQGIISNISATTVRQYENKWAKLEQRYQKTTLFIIPFQ